ncbi:MAG: homoserine dehydrogenase [Candidatus Omnitrophota bacterium]
MNKLTIGLIGFGNVGSGVVSLLEKRKEYLQGKFHTDFVLKSICDKYIDKRKKDAPAKVFLTKNIDEVLQDKNIDVIIELIGGIHPAKEIAIGALKNKKHLITANKALLSEFGKELFHLTAKYNRNIYFESSVGAGTPMIRTITEGLAGNRFNGLYGIINGTCNFILTGMTKKNYSFKQALLEAQQKGFAERNPTLDINGIDSAHKLAILIYLALGKSIKVKDIYTEGITHISHADIEHAESLNLTIKLLGIAKKVKNQLEARVHPTLIAKDHPLASINHIYNAVFLDADPLGEVLLSGEGAGKMAAASGVLSDLINLASRRNCDPSSMLGNIVHENRELKLRKIDHIWTRFYIRFMATDKPGVLSKISGILGKHGVSIESVTQKVHSASTVPVIMLTDYAPEKMVRVALEKIFKLSIVKSKPVAIRMENLK